MCLFPMLFSNSAWYVLLKLGVWQYQTQITESDVGKQIVCFVAPGCSQQSFLLLGRNRSECERRCVSLPQQNTGHPELMMPETNLPEAAASNCKSPRPLTVTLKSGAVEFQVSFRSCLCCFQFALNTIWVTSVTLESAQNTRPEHDHQRQSGPIQTFAGCVCQLQTRKPIWSGSIEVAQSSERLFNRPKSFLMGT